QEALRWELEEGRQLDTYYARLNDVKRRVREQLGHLFRADPVCFALTDSTTHAINVALWGLPIQAGDELVVTNVEHPGGALPAFIQRARRGCTLKVVDGTLPDDDLLEALERALTARTRAVVCSHVSWSTGRRLPIERMAQLAHERGAYLVVDGAQGAGAEPFNLPDSGVDLYALPGQKWLCGPDGTGALYVRRELWPQLDPTYIGDNALLNGDSLEGYGTFAVWPDARRYEHTPGSLPNWAGWLESLQFLRVKVGWDYAYTRIHGLSGQLIEQLLDIDHVRILTPRESRVGLVNFTIRQLDPNRFVHAARERQIYVRAIPDRGAIRACTGFYNSDDDIARLVQLVKNAHSL
ncbi:MAG: aminotransferase class V-fold PLP-dependent enzyme, partial [Alicyclobacillaceae bacterium]|nr:aminotransferase class V-fold PLP-dependent enzyme [Alicyclobacillaceae bacterium]